LAALSSGDSFHSSNTERPASFGMSDHVSPEGGAGGGSAAMAATGAARASNNAHHIAADRRIAGTCDVRVVSLVNGASWLESRNPFHSGIRPGAKRLRDLRAQTSSGS
jgi:hypothetical protein